MRLEESKTKLAKTILNSLDGVGDDTSYYNAVKAYSNQKINEKLGKIRKICRIKESYCYTYTCLEKVKLFKENL